MSSTASSPSIYYRVFAGLILLTLLTVALSFLDLGPWHTVVGLVIGVAKGLLVVLFFMHLLHESWLCWLALGAGLFWLGIMLTLTLTDYLSRHTLAY